MLGVAHVKALQHFLLDAAKRYAVPSGIGSPADLLASAAALDYVLLLASERPEEMVASAGPVAAGARESMTRAVLAALAFIRCVVAAADDVFDDFLERHIEQRRIFDTFRALSEGGVLIPADVDFTLVTTTSDVFERGRAP